MTNSLTAELDADLARIEARLDQLLGRERELAWGWPALDNAVGPLVLGRLYVIGARPSCGKTTLLLSWISRHVDRTMAIFRDGSAEGYWRWSRRLLAFLTERSPHAARVAMAAMRAGYAPDLVLRERWDDLPKGAQLLVQFHLEQIEYAERNGFLQFVDAASPSVTKILEECEKFKPDILIVDYIQRVRPVARQTKFEAISQLVSFLQWCAYKLRVLVIAASQLKRRGDGVFDKYRPPYLEDFKLSGEIEEAADVALGLFRPLRPMTMAEEKKVRRGDVGLENWIIPNAMAVKVLKHRYWGDAADRIARLKCTECGIENWTDDEVRRTWVDDL
ncbi:MAG: hypothetical protein KatS3mg109_0399 [Pirellulaceae bacterium]|nr:MAG: hypothetical protein KatS3mg109_0399 [Pirellulaceae bacterium]